MRTRIKISRYDSLRETNRRYRDIKRGCWIRCYKRQHMPLKCYLNSWWTLMWYAGKEDKYWLQKLLNKISKDMEAEPK